MSKDKWTRIPEKKLGNQLDERPLRSTPASDWRQGQLVTLPSGKTALLRRVSIVNMIAFGRLPNPLLQVAREFSVTGVDLDDAAHDPEQFADFVRFVHYIVGQAFMEPRVNLDPEAELGEGEISILDVDDPDQMFVLSWTQGKAVSLEKFREVPPRADGGGDGATVGNETESVLGPVG